MKIFDVDNPLANLTEFTVYFRKREILRKVRASVNKRIGYEYVNESFEDISDHFIHS